MKSFQITDDPPKPPPPNVRRFTDDGRPTRAQIEFETKLAEYLKMLRDTINPPAIP